MDSTPIGTKTTNGTTSPIELIPVGTKTLEPTPLTRPTELPEQNGKAHVPYDPYPDPSFSDSSLKKKKRDMKKKLRKYKYDAFSDPSSSDNSDSSYNIDYRLKRRNMKSDQKKYLIKLCARLTAKF